MRDFIYKRLLPFLILFQPVIDIITSYMTLHGMNITIGVVIKVLILFLAIIYLLFVDKEKRKFNILFLIFISIFASLNIYNNLDVIKVFTFSYFNYLFKYIYHLVILYFFIRWYKNYQINLYELRIPLIIIVFTYLLSLITNTAYLSYDVYRKGYSGWYSSANELGNILALLYPVTLYNAFHNKDGIKFDIVLVFLTSFCLMMIGTKVGLFGFYLVTVCYLILRLFFIKKLKLDKGFFIMLALLIVSICFISKMPTIYNIKLNIDEGKNNYLLSDRDKIFDELKEYFEKSSSIEKLIGKSHYAINEKMNNILIVEQDFFDILFMYGIVGLLIIIIFYAIIYVHFIRSYLYHRKRGKYSKKYLCIIVAITIELSIAFISGHSLLSPSVSTYLCLIIALSLNINIKDSIKHKKSILVCREELEKLKIDNNKYDVYVLGKNDNYNCINEYSDKKYFKARLFQNKFLAYLLTRNQKFDYCVYNGDSIFKMYYLYYTKAKMKYAISKNKMLKNKINIKKINEL